MYIYICVYIWWWLQYFIYHGLIIHDGEFYWWMPCRDRLPTVNDHGIYMESHRYITSIIVYWMAIYQIWIQKYIYIYISHIQIYIYIFYYVSNVYYQFYGFPGPGSPTFTICSSLRYAAFMAFMSPISSGSPGRSVFPNNLQKIYRSLIYIYMYIYICIDIYIYV